MISASSNARQRTPSRARREFDAVAATENATVAIAISDACAFEDYLDLVDAVGRHRQSGPPGEEINLATFHPAYQGGDAAREDAASHWTNRRPSPCSTC